MSQTRRTSLLLAVVVFQFVLLGIWATRIIGDAHTFQAQPSLPDPANLPLTIESGYPTALAIAREWADEPKLMATNMQVDWPLSVDLQSPIALAPGGWISYTFYRTASASDDPEQTLSLFFERTSGVLVQLRTLDWDEDAAAVPLNPQELPINSASAVITVEAREGRSWRSACPTERHLTRVSLTSQTDGEPTWIVTYEVRGTDRAGLLAHVDAERGELERFEVRADACDSG
jgi:hypothetical protein